MAKASAESCCDRPTLQLQPDASDGELAQLAWAIAHPARVQIVRLLIKRKSCVCGEIVDQLPLAQSTVSQHLKILRTAGLVSAKRQGYWIPYEVDPAGLSDCCGKLVKICARPSCGKREEIKSTSEIDVLLRRRDELLEELHRIESELEDLRR